MLRPTNTRAHTCIVRFIAGAVALLTAIASAAATPISDKYAQLGGSGGFLGTPTIAESVLPDGVGKFRHYQNGSIYWHPATGAREVHGLIRQRWSQLNWELGYLGYPMTDEINLVDGSGKVSKFQGGELIWRSATNQVSEVKSADLVVDWPFPVGEKWRINQANAVNGGSHRDAFAYCWDMVRSSGSSAGRPFVAAATARIVFVEQSLSSGSGNAGNLVIQRFGEGRYGSYLHIKPGSYATQFAPGPGLNLLPQALPWNSRPTPKTGTKLGEVGDTGTGAGNHHMHFCVTTTPDRSAFGPFESVPVAFRNYSVSKNAGVTWTYVSLGVPKNDDWVKREAAKAGQSASPTVNAAAKVISFATVKGKIMLTPGDGKPTGAGTLKIGVTSAWGEPLRSATVSVPSNALNGPWSYQISNVPAFNGVRVWVGYTGPWNRPFDLVGGESTAFNLAPNGAATKDLALKTTSIH